MKKISVIVPLYNNKKYILECIKSIENQDYNKIELIIINDGSTDGGDEVIQKYQYQDSIDVIIINQENLGQSAARNAGIRISTGDYLCFIDSDDFISNKMFSTMIFEMEKNDLDVVQCKYMNWYGENNSKNSIYKTLIEPGYITTGQEFYENYPSLSPCDKIYSKKFLEKINFEFTVGHYAEDVFDISYIHYYAKKMELVDEVFYYYRRVNATSTRSEKSFNKELKLCKDKLFIASKLYSFKKEKNWNGYVDTIIFRSIIGVKFKKIYYLKEYNKILKEYKKELKINEIVKEILNLKIIINSFGIVINKCIKKSD